MHGSMGRSTLYMTHFSFETSENAQSLEATLSLSYFGHHSIFNSYPSITCVVHSLIIPERLGGSCACHCALPEQPPLVLLLLVLGQLTSNTVHYTSVVENDHITLLPMVGIDVLSSIYLTLHLVYHFSNLLDIIHYRDLTCCWVPGGELVNTTTMHLEERPVGIERVSPDHLINDVSRYSFLLCEVGKATYWVLGDFFPRPFRQFFHWYLPSKIGDRQTIFGRFALADILICLRSIGDCGVESELLFLWRQERKYTSAGKDYAPSVGERMCVYSVYSQAVAPAPMDFSFPSGNLIF